MYSIFSEEGKMRVLQYLILMMMNCTCFLVLASSSEGKLQFGFYSKTCPNAEAIVHNVVRDEFAKDENAAPFLLRLHFHDCFVHGCDGSILIDTGSKADEFHAFGHQGVRGSEIINSAKEQLEAVCPGVVSCADIVALAARDAVALVKGPSYKVETGRRDGTVSNKSMADDMPDVADSIQKLKNKFSQKGLTEKDLVLLSAAHTIGTTACFFMDQRLYNFPAPGGSDPSINPGFLPELKSTCPRGEINTRLPMDRISPQQFDNQILNNIRTGFAVLRSDAVLYEDEATKRIVDSYFGLLNPFFGPSFASDFAHSMVRMGRIGVLTGSQGTIRRVCTSFN